MKKHKLAISGLWFCLGLGLFGCTKSENISEPNVEKVDLTDQQIHDFGKGLLVKIQNDELMLKAAFDSGDVKRIENYSLSEWYEYVNTPYGEEENKMEFGRRYFPLDHKAPVYNVCDTAFEDLNLLASSMVHILEDPSNSSYQKIYRQEAEDYQKSKIKCQDRVKLTFDDAWEAYENE